MIKKPKIKFINCRPMIGLVLKDLKAFFLSPAGYLLIGVFDLVLLWLFLQNFFLIGQADLTDFFLSLQWGVLILASALSMKTFVEERQKQTLELLLSLPTSPAQLALAKIITGLIIYLIVIISLIPFVVIVSLLGPIDFGLTASAFLGSFLLFAAFYTYGIFISLYFKNMIISFLFTLFSLFVIYLAGTGFILDRLPELISQSLAAFSFKNHYQSFLLGTPAVSDLVFFLTLPLLFLELIIIRLNRKDKIL
ncbi:MAG: ABC transporter permease [bacterium]|nr:ABC transporter permease [bacterium]